MKYLYLVPAPHLVSIQSGFQVSTVEMKIMQIEIPKNNGNVPI